MEKLNGVDFFSAHSREEVEKIDKRIEEKERIYNAKLKDDMYRIKDFPWKF